MKRAEKKVEIKKVVFVDYSSFEAGRCNNGGQYGFWTEWSIVPGTRWVYEADHRTTADFCYCPYCGRFEQDLNRHMEWCWPERVRLDCLLQKIDEYLARYAGEEEMYVEIHWADGSVSSTR